MKHRAVPLMVRRVESQLLEVGQGKRLGHKLQLPMPPPPLPLLLPPIRIPWHKQTEMDLADEDLRRVKAPSDQQRGRSRHRRRQRMRVELRGESLGRNSQHQYKQELVRITLGIITTITTIITIPTTPLVVTRTIILLMRTRILTGTRTMPTHMRRRAGWPRLCSII